MLSERRYNLLVKIIDHNNKYTINDVATLFQVSTRTIRNDVIAINDFLSQFNLSELLIQDGLLKISGHINLSELNKIHSDLRVADNLYEYRLTKDERIVFIAAILLSATSFITFEKLANQLYVSRSTIINDIDEVKQMVQKKACVIASYANKGLLIHGKERDKRALLLELLFTGVSAYQVSSYPYHMMKLLETDFSTSTDDKIIVSEIVTQAEQAYEIKYTDSSFHKLICYLIIMIRRVKKQNLIKDYATMNEPLAIANTIMKQVTQRFDIQFIDAELNELSNFMLSLRASGQDIEKSRVIVDIQMLTRRFIECISEALRIDLTNDFEFFQNLSFHFESFINDAVDTENPLIIDIMESSPKVLAAVNQHIAIFENYVKRKSNKAEKAYIVVHICAAIERKQNQNSDLTVAIITNVGPGPSQMLQVRLKNAFNFTIQSVVTSREAFNFDFHDVDLIISTMPIQNFKLKYVLVNPLLNDEDYVRIGYTINEIRNNGKTFSVAIDQADMIMREIDPLIKAYENGKLANIQSSIRTIIYKHLKNDKSQSPYLYEFLPESHIQLDIMAENWVEAVRKSANPLLKEGYINENYIQALIDNINENGDYLVIAPLFAIPHESYDRGCHRAGMNLIRLTAPVRFGNHQEAPLVRFICTLCTTNRTIHLKAFFHFVNLLKNQQFRHALEEAKTSSEVANLIQTYEFQ